MATTAEITLSSDISSYGSYKKRMTLTKAGTINDIEETTGFSRRKLAATTAVDLITMANELVEPSDNTAAKVYIKNNGNAAGEIDKTTYVTISIGDTGGTTQQVGRLYGGDWLLMPVTVVDDMDIVAAPSTADVVVLEYPMFYEEA